jgi:glycosyltransferase involved in cell wall biosynthesis
MRESTNSTPPVRPLVSIVIDNYNYARFLPEAIESALAQTYPDTEVIVVDDGSTDDSREIIASYGSRVRPVLKTNGGQASAFNAGFAASRGDVVLFLDSDDTLFPEAVENVVGRFDGRDVTKVHWQLLVVDEAGRPTGQRKPPAPPPEGDFREQVLERGPTSCTSPPTSGNAWARWFLQRVMPVPEDSAYYRVCADEYLYTLAPVLGRVRAIPEPQGLYRVHGRSIYSARPFREKLALELSGHDEQCAALAGTLRRLGVAVDEASWRRHSWFHRLDQSIREIEELVPDGGRFVLVDDGTWGASEAFPSRVVLPFLERDGQHWGAPPDDATAIAELEWMRQAGAVLLVFAWPAFWWLDHYLAFLAHLSGRFQCVLNNERLVAFKLGTGSRSGGTEYHEPRE